MTPRFVFHPAAYEDLREARMWYDAQQSGLGAELGDAIQAALEQIARFPDMYPEVTPGVRRAVLARFPYALFYRRRTADAEVIEILAVFHHRREPATWRRRASG